MRLKAKRDANETAIVKALRAVGVTVYYVSAPGLPDLLIYFRGRWRPIEAKGRRGRLTPAQKKTMAATPFSVVRTVDDALALLEDWCQYPRE